MFHRLIRSTIATAIATAAAVVAIGATSLPADARTVVAFAGRAKFAQDAICFATWNGTMTNYCDGTRTFIVPITVDAPFPHTVVVTGYGASPSNNVSCQSVGVSKDTTTVEGSAMYSLPRFGAAADIVPPLVNVPLGGSLYVSCDVNPRGVINVVGTTW